MVWCENINDNNDDDDDNDDDDSNYKNKEYGSASAQDNIVELKKACTYNTPFLRIPCKASHKTVPMLVWLTTERSCPPRA